jgi:hypothetical protein
MLFLAAMADMLVDYRRLVGEKSFLAGSCENLRAQGADYL